FSFAFLDINPSSEGHTVVIPKQHIEKFTDMAPDQAASLFSSVNKVASKVQEALNIQDSNIGINNGKSAGQEVPHVHVHIIPRKEGDGGWAMQAIIQSKSDTGNLEALAEKIRNTL
ncbi:MAG: HIT family protein, partial [archaeon]|nr:HIT family protein [archaeon]